MNFQIFALSVEGQKMITEPAYLSCEDCSKCDRESKCSICQEQICLDNIYCSCIANKPTGQS